MKRQSRQSVVVHKAQVMTSACRDRCSRRKGAPPRVCPQFGQAVIEGGQSRYHLPHRFGVFRQSEDRHGDGFFVHLHHLINMLLNEMKRVVAHFEDRQTVARWLACR